MTPSYAFYLEHGGSLSKESYLKGVGAAVAHVDWLTGWKQVPQEHEDAYERAVCAVVDKFAEYGTDPVGGFAIGSFRMDDGSKKTGKQLATDAAWEILAPTGLLWAGIR